MTSQHVCCEKGLATLARTKGACARVLYAATSLCHPVLQQAGSSRVRHQPVISIFLTFNKLVTEKQKNLLLPYLSIRNTCIAFSHKKTTSFLCSD